MLLFNPRPLLPLLFGMLLVSSVRSQTLIWDTKLPDPVTSFGACKSGGYLYVYGGHKGEAHVYSKETHSQTFARMNLKDRKEWESLPFNIPIQGFGMAAHEDKIYIVGGSQATNSPKEKSNLTSRSDVAVFDTCSKQWKSLTPLPGPRSSHELVAHGGKLYIIGGWNMENGEGTEWYDHGLVADLSEDPIQWKKLPETKWRVRANSATIVDEKLYAIGGLYKGLSNKVFILDLKTQKWSEGPDYPGPESMKAFGSAACNLDGKLLACAFSFKPHILSEDGKSWKPTPTKVKERRFFHRMVPIGNQQVVFLGGADYTGHLDTIETLDFSSETQEESSQPDPGSIWTGFRGKGNSHTAAKDLPIKWSNDNNIQWRKGISGYGQSTPVVWGSKIFTTSTEGDQSENLLIHCRKLKDGKQLWQKSYPTPVKIKRSMYVSQAAPSPVIDQEQLYVFYESGLLLALDHDGNEKWKRHITEDYGKFEGNHGVGTSLFQSNTHLGLLIDHDGPSYLLKINKGTGKTEWQVDRPKRVSWSTPTYNKDQGKEYVYVSSNGIVEAYDFQSGKQLWQIEGIGGNTVASPAVTKDLVIIGSSAPKQSMALKRFGSHEGKDRIAWIAEDATCSFGSPLATDKYLYYVSRAGVATCNDLKDGKKLWHKRIPGSCWASPILASDKIYFFVKEGDSAVMKSDGSEEILSENTLTIGKTRIYGVAPVNGAFIVRTGSELICIGE